jgi:hypothetical protein
MPRASKPLWTNTSSRRPFEPVRWRIRRLSRSPVMNAEMIRSRFRRGGLSDGDISVGFPLDDCLRRRASWQTVVSLYRRWFSCFATLERFSIRLQRSHLARTKILCNGGILAAAEPSASSTARNGSDTSGASMSSPSVRFADAEVAAA